MKSAGSDSGRCRAQGQGQGQGTVHCPGRCLCWTPDSGHWQLSYEVKIDLCEVNLTRVQLTETCKANEAGARDQLLPGIKRHSLGGFCAPSAWERAKPWQENASHSLAILVPTPHRQIALESCKMQVLSGEGGSCASPRTAHVPARLGMPSQAVVGDRGGLARMHRIDRCPSSARTRPPPHTPEQRMGRVAPSQPMTPLPVVIHQPVKAIISSCSRSQ